MIKIFKPALGFDFENKIAHVAVPELIPQEGKVSASNRIAIVTSKRERWILDPRETSNRGLYADKLPQFALGETRWDDADIRNYLQSNSHEFLDPYTEVFNPIKECLEHHLEFSNPVHSILVSLWVMGTYMFPIFEAYPYLFLNGTRGSGKTKLLELLNYITFNSEITSNATPSSMFRIVESNLSTILVDEGEMLTGKERDKDLQYLLNAGYKKSGVVTRTNSNTMQVEKFSVYSPKVVCSINPLDSTLQSRFITINMIKTGIHEKGIVRVNDSSSNWDKLRDGLYRFALDCAFDVSEVFNTSEKITLLECRNNELWSPLLALAEYLDVHSPTNISIFNKIALLAKEDTDTNDQLDDWHTYLLLALNSLVITNRPYLIKDIRTGMLPYFEDSDEFEKLKGRWIGSALLRFGFKKAARQNTGSAYTLNPEKIKDLLRRYNLSEQSEHSVDMGLTIGNVATSLRTNTQSSLTALEEENAEEKSKFVEDVESILGQ